MAVLSHNPINQSHPLTRGLVSWWVNLPGHRWGGGTISRDLIGHYDGTFTNMDSSKRLGPLGRPGGYGFWEFDGVSDEIAVGTSLIDRVPIASPWSGFCWVITDAAGTFRNAFSFTKTGPNEFIGIGHDDSTPPLLKIGSNGETAGTGSALTVGAAHHIGITYDGGDFHGWLDGVLDYSVTPGANNWQNSTNFGISIDPPGASIEEWLGKIDDVKIYNRELQATEVAALYRESLSGHRKMFNFIQPSMGMPVAAPIGGDDISAGYLLNNGPVQMYGAGRV